MRQQARANPGQWIYSIDPDIGDPNGQVPGWAIRGGYPTTPDGQIDTRGYRANPNYRPGPRTLGLPRPTNRVERALELAATGYGPKENLLRALADAELCMLTVPGQPGHVLVADEAGRSMLVGYTSPTRVPAGTSYLQVPVRTLLPGLGGALLRLNPGTPPTVTLPGDDLVRLLGQ
ncbi:type VII secretion system-associated protein [Gandjariella thermophila]|uniref:SseB protein N-terminal domain-containing protein n=1 Tax=Gandjariella thermophila TaxID=1931992 RepID=A0A4D4JHG9_9PSEU|nr:type VII secretion system-associated protein [Gandjariella thermophila]GDY33836.1 hypothetical protein GTS_54690 [Gandjariella thermophila]